jgi:hypothetical protein
MQSRDSAVGIASGCTVKASQVEIRYGITNRPDQLWGLPNQLCNGYRGALSLEVTRQEREADQSPNSVEVMKTWIYSSIPPYVSMAKCLVKHRENFVRFEVFTAMTIKNGVFWDVMPCGSCKDRRFGGT